MSAVRSLAFAAAVGLLACQQKDEQPAAPLATAAPAPLPAPVPSPTGAPVATAAAPAAGASDLPTPEDFEQQALDEINPQNLEQELDKLEKEIGQ